MTRHRSGSALANSGVTVHRSRFPSALRVNWRAVRSASHSRWAPRRLVIMHRPCPRPGRPTCQDPETWHLPGGSRGIRVFGSSSRRCRGCKFSSSWGTWHVGVGVLGTGPGQPPLPAQPSNEFFSLITPRDSAARCTVRQASPASFASDRHVRRRGHLPPDASTCPQPLDKQALRAWGSGTGLLRLVGVAVLGRQGVVGAALTTAHRSQGRMTGRLPHDRERRPVVLGGEVVLAGEEESPGLVFLVGIAAEVPDGPGRCR